MFCNKEVIDIINDCFERKKKKRKRKKKQLRKKEENVIWSRWTSNISMCLRLQCQCTGISLLSCGLNGKQQKSVAPLKSITPHFSFMRLSFIFLSKSLHCRYTVYSHMRLQRDFVSSGGGHCCETQATVCREA